MSQTLLSTLVEEAWSWDPYESNQIKFNKDGTGTLICRIELVVWIAAEFDWKLKNPECLSQSIDLPTNPPKRPSRLTQFNIEITLTKRRIAALGDAVNRRIINEQLLTDAAFLPKEYTITLETGQFLCASDVGGRFGDSPRFGTRLSFDKSPYPPRQEWRETDGGVDANEFWEWREFCSRRLPERTGLFSRILGSFGG
ncbi:hypothetical protein BDV38DRAFT_232145 [Aspergillus pseudotamarii]|uniref:Uncharacterized protein n=1 Tax=Aspergillus pseudotamarii TaxID=132259 RepID=A0A5N6TBV7_ASPPS|nr:uncharacterized protein BDV38DRAFT_232145 [Aspergillus pseudotamarii]KAE8143868.1 hypothetical protein BDV38DRAFT_232145 [Aspergillus pseudotamarii]